MYGSDLLEEGPAGVPNEGHLTSTITSLLFETVGTREDPLDDARNEAKEALERLRTVNGSFHSNLDYVRFEIVGSIIARRKDMSE